MELLQIKYFKVLAQTENITRAASLLNIAQPSLSQMLKRLEEELGTPLFSRNGKKIALNGAGRIFLRYCDQILYALENAQSEIEEYKSAPVSKVNIAFFCACALIPNIIKSIREDYPKIMPHIFQNDTNDWDLKIFSSSTPLPHSIILEEERIGICMNSEHPLCKKEQICADDILNCNIITLNGEPALTSIAKELQMGNTAMTVASPHTLAELTRMGAGIAVAPEVSWHSHFSDGIVFKPIADIPAIQYIQLILNEKKHLTKAARCCKIVISEYFKDYARGLR